MFHKNYILILKLVFNLFNLKLLDFIHEKAQLIKLK